MPGRNRLHNPKSKQQQLKFQQASPIVIVGVVAQPCPALVLKRAGQAVHVVTFVLSM